MGRPLRRQQPGQYYLVTIRCLAARFFLRPDSKINAAVLEWLTRAQQRFPSLRLHAVCVMSNHIHFVVYDAAGELAAWASFVFGNIARACNRIRGRSGYFFERRYSAEPILDDPALLDRLLYVLTNPVKAGLCDRASQWPGVVLFAAGRDRQEIPVSWIDRSASADEDPWVRGMLCIDPLPEIDAQQGTPLATLLDAREQDLVGERTPDQHRPMSRSRILHQHWDESPQEPARSPRPLCHASDPVLRRLFKEGFASFVRAFREASDCLREGIAGLAFPDWSFPPGAPLIRPPILAGGAPAA